MANYPNPPDQRFAYHRDGTILCKIYQGVSTKFSQGEMESFNDESDSIAHDAGNLRGTYAVCWLFPELRNVTGIFWSTVDDDANGTGTAYGPNALETTTNSTSGIDGTWTSQAISVSSLTEVHASTNVQPYYREAASQLTGAPLPLNNIKGMRMWMPGVNAFHRSNVRAVHIYGNYPDSRSPDRLIITDSTGADLSGGGQYDWEDIAQGVIQDKQFRVKNISATLTATSVRVTTQVLTDANPTLVNQWVISTDGGSSFVFQADIGNLAPGAVSPVYIIRDAVNATAQLSIWADVLYAKALGGFV